MNKHIIAYFSLIICCYSCKSISVNNESQKTTTQNIQLGTIGEQKDFILEQDYNHIALPKYKNLIKVNIIKNSFNKSTYKAFKKAEILQNVSVAIEYVDSSKVKPSFIKLEIADRLPIINSLNNNNDIFEYLKNKSASHIITSLSIAFDIDILQSIQNSDEAYLADSGIDGYVLVLFKDEIEQRIIKFMEGVVFAYQASNFCWQEDDRRQLNIVDIVESTDKCPSNTYRSAKRAKKKINYYKF